MSDLRRRLGATLLVGAWALTSCASLPAQPQPPSADRGETPRALEFQQLVEGDVREHLGASVVEEARAAPTSVLMRRGVSLPRMIAQPDGSWKPEGPHLSVALRSRTGWVHISSAGRASFDPDASRELDRLLASPALWTEPAFPEVSCTDAAGPMMVVRHRGELRTSLQPCGTRGLTGQLANIVMAGRVNDWSGVPQEGRPAGIALTRFDESLSSLFRYSSALVEPVNLVIRSQAEWDGMWRRITARQGNPPPPPPVDFDREMLLLAAYGMQPTGGYSIVIDRVLATAHGLEVHVRKIGPGPTCGTSAALSSPVDMVRIPASPQKVYWLVNETVSDCG